MNRGASVPFHHQLVLSEFIKGVKREMSPEFQDNDVYAFSGLKGQTKVGRNGLHFFSAKVTLVLSSPNEDFLNELLRKIFAKKRVFLSKLELVPETVEKEITPDFQEQMKYICISPLVPTAEELDENYVREYIILWMINSLIYCSSQQFREWNCLEVFRQRSWLHLPNFK
jgi:CRISPR/Cas system endoribonuclease Cas6 (RAMP superfamily)